MYNNMITWKMAEIAPHFVYLLAKWNYFLNSLLDLSVPVNLEHSNTGWQGLCKSLCPNTHLNWGCHQSWVVFSSKVLKTSRAINCSVFPSSHQKHILVSNLDYPEQFVASTSSYTILKCWDFGSSLAWHFCTSSPCRFFFFFFFNSSFLNDYATLQHAKSAMWSSL